MAAGKKIPKTVSPSPKKHKTEEPAGPPRSYGPSSPKKQEEAAAAAAAAAADTQDAATPEHTAAAAETQDAAAATPQSGASADSIEHETQAPETPDSTGSSASADLSATERQKKDANNMKTRLKRIACGHFKSFTAEEKQSAIDALKVYNGIPSSEKTGFVNLYLDNKATKTFGFLKTYAETMNASTTSSFVLHEKYMTRTFIIY